MPERATPRRYWFAPIPPPWARRNGSDEGIRFTLVADVAKFRALEADWRDLCDRAAPHSVFRLFDWQWRAWQHIASARGCGLRILVGRIGTRAVLIWPLVIDGRVIRFLCSEKFEYRDILVEQGPQTAQWIAAAWRQASRLAGGDLLDLSDVPVSAVLSPFLEGSARRGLRRDTSSPVIRLGLFADWDAYAASLPPRLIRDQQRQWRRLEKSAEGHRFHIVTDDVEIDVLVDWIFTHKLDWAAQRSITMGIFPTTAYRSFIKSVLHDGMASGRLMLCRLLSGDRLLSAGFGFVHAGRFTFYMFAYDAAFGMYSPSRLLMERMIRWCMDRRLAVFDFLPGREAYKRIWADAEEAVVDYRIPVTLLGQGRVAWTRSVVRPLASQDWLKRLYGATPRSLRAVLRRRLLADAGGITEMKTIKR